LQEQGVSRENYVQVRLISMMVMADWDHGRDEQTGSSFSFRQQRRSAATTKAEAG
jgi:hypothetical protein